MAGCVDDDKDSEIDQIHEHLLLLIYYYFLRFVISHVAEVELICWYPVHRIDVEMLI